MKLYHGTIHDFDVPNPGVGHEGTDFGIGFYVTESEKMADDWYAGEPNKHVYVYDVTLKNLDSGTLNILRFQVADVEWARFVYNNRRLKAKPASYDLIIGPLADNGLNKWFDRIDRKEISWEELAREISFTRYKSLQYCFKTQDSVKLLEYETRK